MKMPALDRLGKSGVAALGLLLFCLSFYAGNIAPARQELDSLKAEAAKLSAAGQPAEAAARSASASQPLPSFITASQVLKELSSIADQHGVSVERASYQLSDKDGQRRLEIELPMKAGYSSLRAYLRDVLAQPAAPALDELLLQRQQAGEALIEANVRLSYYFAPAP